MVAVLAAGLYWEYAAFPMNLYRLLETSVDSSPQDISAAYKRMSKVYHPDKNPLGAELFVQLSKAKDMLLDSTARSVYDRFGPVDPQHVAIARDAPGTFMMLTSGPIWGIILLMAFLSTMGESRAPARGRLVLVFGAALVIEYLLRTFAPTPLSLLLPYVPNFELVDLNRQLAILGSQIYVQAKQVQFELLMASRVPLKMSDTVEGKFFTFVLAKLDKLCAESPADVEEIKQWRAQLEGMTLGLMAPQQQQQGAPAAAATTAPPPAKTSAVQKVLMVVGGLALLNTLAGGFKVSHVSAQ